eukprot:CAMPEP_0202963838 /NCGR_PEP_ID=MMETSP1396-20130829/7877_1 /ASSEMBLY_ACC=CAM_ASM_000872 /TAXON_ID= /ORGANISM="Pseudokeronopsis sp., Strain Brazil" /LENGTH=279 /DNA_ID=CAMNT_0049685415 /DNA_START=53 /DNA_END=892 /DNA_ORIENTATION=+
MLRISFLVAIAIWCVVFSFQTNVFLRAEDAKAPELLPSALLDSVVNRDIDGIGHALENGEEIDLTNDRGWSAARFAVAIGDLNVLHELIDRGIDLNNADGEGVTPLMAAAAAGDKEMVEVLLAGNASPLQTAADGQDAYHSAVNAGRQVVALLIAESSAIHAIESDNKEALVTALTRGAYVNIRNGAGWTPMMYAVARGDIDLVKTVLKYGPDLNRTENDGWTALHFAASAGQLDIVKILLENNADAFIRNERGETAREVAIRENHKEVADLLPAHEGL